MGFFDKLINKNKTTEHHIETQSIEEEFRNKLSDKVFITNSLVSAEKYAKLSSLFRLKFQKEEMLH